MNDAKWATDGCYNLAKVKIVSATAATYAVDPEYKTIMGWMYFGKRTNAGRYKLFDTPREAIAYMLADLADVIEETERHVKKLHEKESVLTELRAMLEADERKADSA